MDCWRHKRKTSIFCFSPGNLANRKRGALIRGGWQGLKREKGKKWRGKSEIEKKEREEMKED